MSVKKTDLLTKQLGLTITSGRTDDITNITPDNPMSKPKKKKAPNPNKAKLSPRKKKKAKKTQYTKERERIMRYIRSQRKKGIEIGVTLPTERQLRKQGVSGLALARKTRELKKLRPQQLKELRIQPIYDELTGEIIGKLNPFTGELIYEKSKPVTSYDEKGKTAPMFMVSKNIISNWKHMIVDYPYTNPETREMVERLLESWLEKALARCYGDYDSVAQALEDAHAMDNWETYYAYTEELMGKYLYDLWVHLPDIGEFATSEFMEQMEEEFGTGLWSLV